MASSFQRKFLVINPNTNPLTTQRLREVLGPKFSRGLGFELCTARFGARYIACEASHAVAAHACLDAWAEHRSTNLAPLEGVLIACFGDPGLFALREVAHCPVTGLAEASFIQAAVHGPFAVVTGGERWKPMLLRLAQSLGFDKLLIHVETVKPTGAALQADPQMAIRCLAEACEQATKHGARAIILGGAGLAGYAQMLKPHVNLPLIDSAVAGFEVITQALGPAPNRPSDGLQAQWTQMPEAFNKLG